MTLPLRNSTQVASTQGTLIPIQQSPLLQMPNETLTEIFKRMRPVDIGTCQMVCKRFYSLFSQNDVWKKLFENHFPNRIVIPNEINNFQKAYKDRLYNLHKGCFSLQFVGGPKTTHRANALAGRFFYSTYDGIEAWDLITKTKIGKLSGNDCAYCIVPYKEKLFFASDNEITIWDLNTNTCKATLKGHTDVVCSIAVVDDILFSGSWDRTIKIWDLNTNSCITTIDGYSGRATFLDASKGKLFSRFDNGTYQIWDFEAGHNEILEELAYTLEKGIFETNGSINYLNQARAMDQFLKMPKAKRNKIYGELYKILKPLNLIQQDYRGCAEHAFHDQNGQSSTPAQKAQAIRNFLKEEFS